MDPNSAPQQPSATPNQQPANLPTAPATPGVDKKIPSAFDLFKPSWEALKLNFITFLLLILIPIVLSAVFVIQSLHSGSHVTSTYNYNSFNVTSHPASNSTFNNTSLMLLLLSGLVWLFIGPALIYAQLKSVQHKKVSVSESLKGGLHFVLRMTGLWLCIGVLIIVGFILLIVPGFIMIRRYLLAPYMLIDKNLSITEAMKQSAALSKKYRGAIWGIIGVEFLLSFLGIIPILGLIISYIGGLIYYFAAPIRYEQLKAIEGESTPATAAPTTTAQPAV